MKKHRMNPVSTKEYFFVIGLYILLATVFAVFFVRKLIIYDFDVPISDWIGFFLGLTFIVLLILFLDLCERKARGIFYIDGTGIIFKKRRKVVRVEFENIKRIENAMYFYATNPRYHGEIRQLWRFFVYIKDQKMPLDMLITNEIMVNIASEHNIPFRSRQPEAWKAHLEKYGDEINKN